MDHVIWAASLLFKPCNADSGRGRAPTKSERTVSKLAGCEVEARAPDTIWNKDDTTIAVKFGGNPRSKSDNYMHIIPSGLSMDGALGVYNQTPEQKATWVRITKTAAINMSGQRAAPWVHVSAQLMK